MSESLADATAVILAGGFGLRLRPALSDRPKVLADVSGRPFLTYLLDQLCAAGSCHVVICTGHLGEQIRSRIGERYGQLVVSYSQELRPLGTAGALAQALPLCRSESILAMNGDSFCQADLGAFWSWHQQRQSAASLLLTCVADTSRYGKVVVEGGGQITHFEEKGASASAGWINAGVYVLSRRFLESIPAGRAVSIERQMFPAWIGRGLHGYQEGRQFLDIGTPESYAQAEQFFKEIAE